MKFSYLRFATFGLLGLAGFFAMSCGSDQQRGVSEPRVYQPTSGVTQLEASIDGLDELRFVLLNDQQTDTMLTFTTTNGYFDVTLERIPADEIYFLEIRGQAAGYEEQGGVEWREIVPIFARDGATLQLAATPNDTTASLSKLDFFIEGGGEEQDFIQSWHDTYIQKRDELDDQITHEFVLGGRQVRSQRNARDEAQAQLDNITREYIEQGKPLASTMFLISQGNDHRSKVEEYSSLYENANSEVRDTKYGIDLNNRLHRITQYNPNLDFENLLAARNSQLLPFQVKDYDSYEYLVLSFWSTRFPEATESLKETEEVVPASHADRVGVIHISLDTKMSSWKPVNDTMDLQNSFMIRAEVRQKAIDELYLTELPRYMIVKPDGTVIENDIPFEDLEEAINSL